MSTINAYERLKLTVQAQRYNNGEFMDIVEALTQVNPILADMPILIANDGTGHKISRRTSLPTGTFREVNGGVVKEATKTTPFREVTAHLEGRSEVDEKLLVGIKDPQSLRRSEDVGFLEGLSQTMASTMIYGNLATDPEQFDGFATRRNTIDGENTFDNGGTGSDLTSIFIARYSPTTLYGIVPENAPLSILTEDLGKESVEDADGNKFSAFVSKFIFYLGIVERDVRFLKRIANIETAGSTNIFDDHLLITALNKMPGSAAGANIYVSPTIKTQMDIWATDKTNVSYTSSEVGGVPTTFFRGNPVKQNDSIVDTETQVL